MDKIAVVEYEYPEIIKSAKTETIKSYSLVPEYCDESFSIQDSLVAGDDQQESELSCVANDELGKTLPDRHKPFAEMSKAAEVTGVTIAKTSKCYLLVDYSSSDESVSLTDASMAANEDSELDLCRVLKDESGKTRPDNASTPRKVVKGKKRSSALSQEENKEKERQIAAKKAEREHLHKEKEEEKKKKEEERETKKKKKEKEKKMKEEEKEAERKRKEAEKKKKEEEKEAERKRKEEEKRIKEENKEAERKRKEEEKKRKEVEKENAKKIKEDEERRKKENFAQKYVKHAPDFRTEFDTSRREYLEQILKKSDSEPSVDSNLRQYRAKKGRSYGATWPLKDNNVGVIDEDEAEAPINNETIVTIVHPVPHRMRPKLVQFWENRRPAYWGTWRKSSNTVGPRRPFGKDITFDYDVDSDDEWEEEVEPGESLTDSEGEGEENEPADEYEVDNEFLVPHGYLSDEEGEKDEDERALSPSAAKMKLKLKEEQFERELKKNPCYIKPSLIGCCWSDDLNLNPQHLKVLERHAAVVLCSTLPIQLKSEDGELDENIAENSTKRLISDTDIPTLIRIIHGSIYTKPTIIKELLLYLERSKTETSKVPSTLQISTRIAKIASWENCAEIGENCWIVYPDVLNRYGLTNLSIINSWEFAAETKKRGRKRNFSTTDTDDEITPAKVQHLKVLERYAPSVLSSTLPIELKSEGEESDDNIDKKSTKRLVNEKDIPDLIRVLHGSLFGRSTIVQEFQLHLERNRAGENQNGPSQKQILAKISEIASYSRCTEAGAMSGKICWLVQPSVLEHYNLAELSVINAWEFATETKKRGRKTNDSEEDTPLAKISRVSPIKQFDQPASLPANRVSSSQENELPESGKDSNVPAKQPIFSTPKGKKTHLVDKSPNICNQETQE